MKRIFTIIIILISLSMVGIIAIQVSWIKNMVLLKQEQVKHDVQKVTEEIAENLSLHKGSYASGTNRGLLSDEYTLDLSKPLNSTKSNYDLEEIKTKLKSAFLKHNLKDIQ